MDANPHNKKILANFVGVKRGTQAHTGEVSENLRPSSRKAKGGMPEEGPALKCQSNRPEKLEGVFPLHYIYVGHFYFVPLLFAFC